jgi:hypothetical protein
LLCLSAGRPTQNAQRWQNLLGRVLNLALCVDLVNLWEYICTEWESNLWFFPFGSFDSRTSGGWMGGARRVLEPSKIRFFLFFFGGLDRTALRTFASPLDRSFSRSLAGYPTPPPRTLACRTSPTSLMTSCDDKTWSASAKLPNLDSCITYAFGVSSDDQKESERFLHRFVKWSVRIMMTYNLLSLFSPLCLFFSVLLSLACRELAL